VTFVKGGRWGEGWTSSIGKKTEKSISLYCPSPARKKDKLGDLPGRRQGGDVQNVVGCRESTPWLSGGNHDVTWCYAKRSITAKNFRPGKTNNGKASETSDGLSVKCGSRNNVSVRARGHNMERHE